MTAESLKPFLNLPNATATDLKTNCSQRSAVGRYLTVLGWILVAAVGGSLIGVQIWHVNRTIALEREVDDLKLQLQQYNRAGEFNDYEFDNELFVNPDEYDAGYEPDLDPDLPGEREASELLESGLASSGMLDQDGDDEDGHGGATRRSHSRRDEDDEDDDVKYGDEYEEDDGDDDDPSLYESEDISVTAAVAGGKRRARSISGVTRQGVPIVDEPYVPRRSRTRQPHRIFEQLRQRPEEVVTPPTSTEMFRWDAGGRSGSSQQQTYGSISIRPMPQKAHPHQDHYTTSTTPMPPFSPPAGQLEFQMVNRKSRVQNTNNADMPGKHMRFSKVISNPGTPQEFVRSPEIRGHMRSRSAGRQPRSIEPFAKGIHYIKQHKHETATMKPQKRHMHWSSGTRHAAIDSETFRLGNDELIVKEPGLYYVYAQITYHNNFLQNGFVVMVNQQKYLSCSVHAGPKNASTCFTAGLVKVENSDTHIVIEDYGTGREHIMQPERSFFGAFKVGRLQPPSTQLRNT